MTDVKLEDAEWTAEKLSGYAESPDISPSEQADLNYAAALLRKIPELISQLNEADRVGTEQGSKILGLQTQLYLACEEIEYLKEQL